MSFLYYKDVFVFFKQYKYATETKEIETCNDFLNRYLLNPFQFNVVLSFIGFQDELKAIWGKVYIYIGNCHKHFFNFDKNILTTFIELNQQQEGLFDTRLGSK